MVHFFVRGYVVQSTFAPADLYISNLMSKSAKLLTEIITVNRFYRYHVGMNYSGRCFNILVACEIRLFRRRCSVNLQDREFK
jgi:hypothetical protein